MQTFPRHHIGLRTQDVMHAFLHVHQFDQAEARIVGVEEKIHIAFSARLLASHRPEQVKTGYAETMQLGFMST